VGSFECGEGGSGALEPFVVVHPARIERDPIEFVGDQTGCFSIMGDRRGDAHVRRHDRIVGLRWPPPDRCRELTESILQEPPSAAPTPVASEHDEADEPPHDAGREHDQADLDAMGGD